VTRGVGMCVGCVINMKFRLDIRMSVLDWYRWVDGGVVWV